MLKLTYETCKTKTLTKRRMSLNLTFKDIKDLISLFIRGY